VNLALGDSLNSSTTGLISLLGEFNQTGTGTFCMPKVAVPADAKAMEGMEASIQVVQVTDDGNALYNVSLNNST
jgi:hypothetical protein